MHIPKPVALALLATLAHAAPAPSQEEKQLSAREKMDKRIFGVVEAGLFLLNMVFAGLQFMDSPPPPWDPESGNCVSTSSPSSFPLLHSSKMHYELTLAGI